MSNGGLQQARVIDVLVLGPFMVWFGLQSKGLPGWARGAMAFSGLATMWFNARNYVVVKEALS